MYKAIDDSCFMVPALLFAPFCTFFRLDLHVVYARNQRWEDARSCYFVQMIHQLRPRDPGMTRKVAKKVASRTQSGVKYGYREE